MLGTHSLALFATTVFVINATPGVDMMLTLTRTLRYGVRGGLAAAAGIMAGCVVHALAAVLGLAALIAASAAAFTVIKWAGAAYLLWLAFGMLKSALSGDVQAATPQLAESPGLGALFRQGEGWALYRVVGDRAVLTPVETGIADGNYRVVVSGLEPGAQVILFPGSAVKGGQRVEARKPG